MPAESQDLAGKAPGKTPRIAAALLFAATVGVVSFCSSTSGPEGDAETRRGLSKSQRSPAMSTSKRSLRPSRLPAAWWALEVPTAWGRNDRGNLGDSSTEDRDAPVPIATGFQLQAITRGFPIEEAQLVSQDVP